MKYENLSKLVATIGDELPAMGYFMAEFSSTPAASSGGASSSSSASSAAGTRHVSRAQPIVKPNNCENENNHSPPINQYYDTSREVSAVLFLCFLSRKMWENSVCNPTYNIFMADCYRNFLALVIVLFFILHHRCSDIGLAAMHRRAHAARHDSHQLHGLPRSHQRRAKRVCRKDSERAIAGARTDLGRGRGRGRRRAAAGTRALFLVALAFAFAFAFAVDSLGYPPTLSWEQNLPPRLPCRILTQSSFNILCLS